MINKTINPGITLTEISIFFSKSSSRFYMIEVYASLYNFCIGVKTVCNDVYYSKRGFSAPVDILKKFSH